MPCFATTRVLRYIKKSKLNVVWCRRLIRDMHRTPSFKAFNADRIDDRYLALAAKRTEKGEK